MKNWILSLIVAIVLLLAPSLTGVVTAQSDMVLDTTLESGTSQSDNTTDNATDNATQTKGWWLRLRGVPGKGILTAPGLQKPFHPNWKGFKAFENKLRLTTQQQTTVEEQAQNKGGSQHLQVREKTRQETQLQEQAGTAQQTQNHNPAAGPEAKGKGKKGKP